MLTEKYSLAELRRIITKREDYQPHPKAVNRDQWESLPADVKEQSVKKGERYLDYDWPLLTATGFMEYFRSGNRENFQNKRRERRRGLATLLIAECVESKSRFLDEIIDVVWMICEESEWTVPAHSHGAARGNYRDILPPPRETQGIALFSALTGALLSWTYYLLKESLDKVSPRICDRIYEEVKTRILDKYLAFDFWWMSSHNNWNPQSNSRCLPAILLLEKDEERRITAIKKMMNTLENFLNHYPEDGGCEEGPAYWNVGGISMFNVLDQLYEASNHEINIFDEKIVQNIGKFIYKVHAADDYYFSYSDAFSVKLKLQPDILYRYGKFIDDPELMQFGIQAYYFNDNEIDTGSDLTRCLSSIFRSDELRQQDPPGFPYPAESWLPVTEIASAREREGSKQGLYFAIKGGHNKQPHNHNDVGQFIIFADGKPYLIDPGSKVYSKKTFSSRRYEIWTMRSSYHNLPTINGAEQAPGRDYEAKEVVFHSDHDQTGVSIDIAGAYPEDSGLHSWKRSLTLFRGNSPEIELKEDFSIDKDDNEITWSFMTVCDVAVTDDDNVKFIQGNDETLLMTCSEKNIKIDVEEIELKDSWLHAAWGDLLRRVQVTQNVESNPAPVKFLFTLDRPQANAS